MGTNKQPRGEHGKFAPLRKEEKKVTTLTFKALNKQGTEAIYSGLHSTISIPLAAFLNKTPLPTLTLNEEFAPQRVKLTEEEKAARKLAKQNAPKPTLEQRIAKREDQLVRDRAKLAAQQTAPQQS